MDSTATSANLTTSSDLFSTAAASEALATSTPEATTSPAFGSSEVCNFGLSAAELRDNAGILIAFLVLMIVTVVGNLLIILAIQKEPRLRTVGNMYYQSLAAADLLVGLLVMPPMLLYTLHGCWPLGVLACDLWMAVDFLCCTASFFGLCAIAADRYRAISDPFRHMKTKSRGRTKAVIIAVWLAAGLAWVPAIFVIRALSGDDVDYNCDYSVSAVYALVSSVVIYYVPILTMITYYVLLFQALRKQLGSHQLKKVELNHKQTTCDSHSSLSTGQVTVELPSISEVSDLDGKGKEEEPTYGSDLGQRRERDEQRVRMGKERRAARMLGVIMSVFLLCWLPWVITWPIGTFHEEWISDVLYEISSWAAYLNSGINPFLYVFINRDFRRSVARMFQLHK